MQRRRLLFASCAVLVAAATLHCTTYAASDDVDVSAGDASDDTTSDAAHSDVTQPSRLAEDFFERQEKGGFGQADLGGSWTVTNPALSRVDNGSGRLQAALGTTIGARLEDLDTTSVDVRVTIAVPANLGGDVYPGIDGRIGQYLGQTFAYTLGLVVNEKRFVTVSLDVYDAETKKSGKTAVASKAGIFVLANEDTIKARFQVLNVGSSAIALKARVWSSSTTESDTWDLEHQLDVTSADQLHGFTGLRFYASTSLAPTAELGFDDFSVTTP